MIESHPEDNNFNNTRRIAHNGTFNANPLSAVAGIRALELISEGEINNLASKAGENLKQGLNEMLGKLEIPGCATGINSLIFLRLNTDPDEADPEKNITAVPDIRNKADSLMQSELNLAFMNNGVHAGNAHGGARFIMSSAHTEDDINKTVSSVAKALSEVREQGLL